MRTNVEIDDRLMRRAMKASGKLTKKAVVEEALSLVVQLKQQEKFFSKLWGIGWEGDLNVMRKSRFLNEEGFHDRPEWHDTDSHSKRGEKKSVAHKTVAAD